MADLPPVPHKAPMIDRNGILTPIWADWFKKVFQRVGGHLSSTNDELAARFPVVTADIGTNAVTAAKIATSVAGDGLTGGNGSALAVNVDGSTIEINSDSLRVKDAGIAFAKFVAGDWTRSHATSGYQKLPSGLYVQWGITGSLNSATTNSISLPVTFPTACLQVIAGIRDNSGGTTTDTGHWGTGNYSTTAFDLYNRTNVAYTFNWWAVGH